MKKRRRFFAAPQQHHGEQPGRERPHLRTPDPDPGVGHGVAHVPAACLRSCDGLRTPMSRTIDSGSNRKMHETMRRAIRHDSLPIVSGDDAGDVTVDLASHLSPWLLREHSPIALWILMRCSAASTLSAALRPCVPHGLRALTPPTLRLSRQIRDGRGFDRR
jgi:hypothetical protein